MNPQIIYECDSFIVVSKPAGMLTHPTVRGEAGTLAGWLLERFPEISGVGDEPATRPGIVHRLDKDTSGVMVAARTRDYFEYLKGLFAAKKIKKIYWAAAEGKVPRGEKEISAPISLRPGTTKRTLRPGKMTKPAVTRYKALRYFPDEAQSRATLLEVMPLTGRTHQIRVHLRGIGHPVIGDPLYGRRISGGGGPAFHASRLLLHAYALEFEAEPGNLMRFESEPPADFWEALRSYVAAPG